MANDLSPRPAAGTWFVEEKPLQAATQQPVVATLDELGVIAVEGDDATSFLQAQLTNDVAHLDQRSVQLNGYCSPKGRLYAVFDNWRTDGAVLLQLPREILPAVLKRLSMFVLRARAKLRDASDEWITRAVLGPGSADWVSRLAGRTLGPGEAVDVDGTRIARLSPAPRLADRFLLLSPAALDAQWEERLSELLPVPSGVFWWSQIDAAIPNVFSATQDKFVPQMINFEVLGGVNFKKGCYPGQEVVARSQYLGKLRRRMHLAHTDGATRAGADVFGAGAAEPVGTVVMAASAPEGGMDLLFECPAERAAQHATDALCLDSPSGPLLQLRPLPYALVDVTA